MSKFKIGDKVKLINNNFTIKDFPDYGTLPFVYETEQSNGDSWFLREEELELIDDDVKCSVSSLDYEKEYYNLKMELAELKILYSRAIDAIKLLSNLLER